MSDLSNVSRPFTLPELATAFGVSPRVLERIASKWSIAPACRVGRIRMYGATQTRQLHDALLREYPADGPALAVVG